MVPTSDRSLALLEVKASRTVTPAMADPLLRLRQAVGRYDMTSLVVHRGTGSDPGVVAIRPGVKAVSVDRLPFALATPAQRRSRRQARTG